MTGVEKTTESINKIMDEELRSTGKSNNNLGFSTIPSKKNNIRIGPKNPKSDNRRIGPGVF